ncbi:MAG: hypothetical protein CFE43_01170 [Burkholderiales bacterium PBB3]|nr:MAG: hypothetical protein CFE43_01170 [Burkholderiales bacterium PBB3]
MFKAVGNVIHKTPWWVMVSGGLITLLVLVLFTVPIQVIRLHESGNTPQEQRAIEREINLVFGDRALNFAEDIVQAMRARTQDNARQQELEHALAEIARAKKELATAQYDFSGNAKERAAETTDQALEAARDAAQTALEAAISSREAVEQAKADAIDLLRERGLDTAATAASFGVMLRTAQDNEKAAAESLESIEKMRRSVELEGHTTPTTPTTPTKPTKPTTPTTATRPTAPAVPPAPPAMPAIPAVPAMVEPPELAMPPAPPAPPGAPKSQFAGIHLPAVVDMTALPDGFRGEIRRKVDGDMWRIGVGSALILAFIPLFVMLLISKYFLGRSRRAIAVAEEKTQQAEVSDMSRQITEARLQALQAQVEPHFLYNTLANVQALTEVDPPAANQMVGHLIQYLRASLPKMRENTSTVGQELELVRAYLNILQMRMGGRLEFSIAVPDDLLAKSFPPMMLPSLVENAIKHGLEPVREGGRIDVLVQRIVTPQGDRITIEVKDTGKGLVADSTQPGGGVGLSNLRERLAAIYGHNARFTIESNTPRGVVATIDIPTEAPSAPGTVMAQRSKPQTVVAPIPATGWRKAVDLTSKSHSVWARIVSRTFMVLMVTLCVVFLLALLSLYTGWMPVQVGDFQLDGMEGMALGSVGLLAAFGALALAILIVVAVMYGLGFLFAALLVFIPAMILISLFPVVSPFILIGLIIYWVSKKRKKDLASARKADLH